MTSDTICYRFREARKAAGMSAEQAAVKLGVSISTLFSWERGQYLPRANDIRRMATIYDVSADYLLGDDA